MLAPLGWKHPVRWLIFLAGALIFGPSIVLVQLPLQRAVSYYLVDLVGLEAYQRDIIFLSIPAVILSGVVQEAAKLIPIIVYWLIRKRELVPRFSLGIGALAGAGYGVFEAYWLLSEIFAAGFSLSWLSAFGLIALAGFWERFFTIAFHSASGAVLGWGLAKRKGWLFYLLTTFWHFILNYTVVLFQTGVLSNLQVEFLIALLADALFFLAFWLRWRTVKFPETETPPLLAGQVTSAAEPMTTSDGETSAETLNQAGTAQPQSQQSNRSVDKDLESPPEKPACLPGKIKPDVSE